MFSFCILLVTQLIFITAATSQIDSADVVANNPWNDVKTQLDAWVLSGTDGFGFVVGNASGVQFSYAKAPFSLHQVIETVSTSKWPMAMMLAELRREFVIKFRDEMDSPRSMDHVCGMCSVNPR